MDSLIKQKIDSIAECIFTKIQKNKSESFGLFSEEFGSLLFLLYYTKIIKNEKHISLIENYAEKILERSVNETRLHTFCSGLSGILYLFEFLRENNLIDLDVSDMHSLFDNYLLTRMRLDISNNYYDFMHGALGVGLYFLKKDIHPEYIKELIDFLYNTAEKENDNKVFKWQSVVDFEKNHNGYNLSLSHGISSIIIFLTRVIKNGLSDKRIEEMITGAVNYLLSQEKNFSQFGCFFQNYILKDSPEVISKSRLAWCYGDLGIGLALWQAGKAMDKSEWKEKSYSILLQSTQRQRYSESFVIDAGICHGSAGIAMIYHRMYFETKQDEFMKATQYWINQTLNLSGFKDGLAGYKTFYKDRWECDYTLLTGVTGIGLVLLSYLEKNQQTWDEMFLLS